MQEMTGLVHVDDSIAKFCSVVPTLLDTGSRAKELHGSRDAESLSTGGHTCLSRHGG